MSPNCTTRRGTHAWCQFLCASPRVHAPARALVVRVDTATRKLPLARRVTCVLVHERTKSICPPPPPPSPRFSHTCSHSARTLRSHSHTQTRPLITHTRVRVHTGTHSRPRMAQHARANACTQACTLHGARHGAAVGPVPVALGPFLGYLFRRRRRSVGLAHWVRTSGVRTRSAGARTVLVALAVVRRLGVSCMRSGLRNAKAHASGAGLAAFLG